MSFACNHTDYPVSKIETIAMLAALHAGTSSSLADDGVEPDPDDLLLDPAFLQRSTYPSTR